ncbi:probably inactive leucine-rich repeat receptor-like protein kinase IMK2 [Nymphaea colorata]|nr:probably inactive leucine-rich repeat receptor-like protein kinase IMK2 [Nymphaea colorata]
MCVCKDMNSNIFPNQGEFPLLAMEKKKKKKMMSTNSYFLSGFLVLQFFLLQMLATPVSGQSYDGIVVTQSDFQALQAFKHAFDDPKGVLRSWNDSGASACSGGWVGIKCVRGQVISIQLPWKGLGGRISEKIGQLSALRKLSLHDNLIQGFVPTSLGWLRDLRGVYLFNNRLSGQIPPSIVQCSILQALDLSNNALTGVIPTGFGNSSKLYRLNLSFNSLSGPIPADLSRIPSLTFIALQHNNLSGSIPDNWGSSNSKKGAAERNYYQLQILNLDYNSFSGPFPASISRMGRLEEITLSHNQINGSIPAELGELPRLQTLDISYNNINGSFPQSLSNLSSLARLNIANNRIQGNLPDTMNGLKNLKTLVLRRNHLSGSIPETLGNISGLLQLDLAENSFNGSIPASIGELSDLNALNVSYNNLSGAVPTQLWMRFNSSSFVGNLQLCGYSSSVPCPSPPPPPPASNVTEPSSFPSSQRQKLSKKDIILIAAGVLLAILLLLCCILLCCLMLKKTTTSGKGGEAAPRKEKAVPTAAADIEGGGEAGGKLVHFDGPFVFTADDLLCATAEVMGKSTYGTVYKATLEDGNQVAVKRLREKIAKNQREFETEVNMLGKIRHPNLLALRAYYLGPKGEKLLVFDFMPRGSLAAFLHARGPETPINWRTRMNIAIGAARGLSYLHNQENIVHGNLTSGNILLDEQINAKIADFGLSRLMTAAANSNVVATAGALGYRAPELSKLKKASTKTDIYSLGVILLELLTGKAPGESMNGVDLPQWVASIVKEEWTNEVFDLELMRDDAATTGDELLNTLKLALHCVDPSPTSRPDIQQVLQQLEEIKPELAMAPAAPSTTTVPAAGTTTDS